MADDDLDLGLIEPDLPVPDGYAPLRTHLDEIPPMRLPRTGRGRQQRLECIRLLSALANLMSDLDEFWRQVYCWEMDRLKRLFGFPVIPAWTERALSGDALGLALRYQMDQEVGYLMSLPEDSAAVYRRAQDRIGKEHDSRSGACAAVWYPVFGYLVDHPWVFDYLSETPKAFAPRQLTS